MRVYSRFMGANVISISPHPASDVVSVVSAAGVAFVAATSCGLKATLTLL